MACSECDCPYDQCPFPTCGARKCRHHRDRPAVPFSLGRFRSIRRQVKNKLTLKCGMAAKPWKPPKAIGSQSVLITWRQPSPRPHPYQA